MNPAVVDEQLERLEAALVAARRAILRVEATHCEVDQLGRLRGLLTRFKNTVDGVNADIARRADELRRGGNGRPVDDAVNPGGRQSPAAEQVEKDRGRIFDAIPGLEDATKAGVLSGRYSDIVARAIKPLDREVRAEFSRRHQDLAEIAASMSEHRFRLHVQHLVEVVLHDCGVERAERQRRNRKASSWVDIADGMWCLRGAWDPDTGAAIAAVLDAEVNAIFHSRRDDPSDTRNRHQVMADAVTNLLCGTPVSSSTCCRGATMLVITDHQTASDGIQLRSVHEYADGSPVSDTALRRVIDDPATTTLPVTVNEHGVVTAVGEAVLDEGRTKRFATAAQRLALRAMYRTCMVPGCDVPFDACEIHHLVEWDRGGRTDMANLGPSCVRHHHQGHAEGWQLHVDPTTRRLTITDRDGATTTHAFHGLAPPGRNEQPARTSRITDAAEELDLPPPGRPARDPVERDVEHPRSVVSSGPSGCGDRRAATSPSVAVDAPTSGCRW